MRRGEDRAAGSRGVRFDLEAQELGRAEAEGFDRPPAEALPAAGVILGRDAPGGPEVLLVRRRSDVGFAAGAYVFPGGTLSAEDGAPRWRTLAEGWGAHAPEVAPFAVAACRELFEETGVLFALGPGGASHLHAGAVRQMRTALLGGRSFIELVAGAGLRLDLRPLVLCARWITPVPLSRRYDARFFLAEAPAGARVATEGAELTEHLWIRPAEALERYDAGKLPMLFPTATTLGWFRDGRSVAEWLERHRGAEVEPVLPRLRRLGTEVRPVVPGTREYVEGALTVVRAPNPGPLTLDGTCTYLVGAREVVILDPGPRHPAHLEAILGAIPARGRVVAVAITHGHPDHAEAAPALANRLGVRLYASPIALEKLGVSEHRSIGEGEAIEFEGDELAVVPTPGHSADHVCFVWREAKALFCGDVILGTGSAIVAPPGGDLAVYLDTLRRLHGLDLLVLYPGHGPPVTDPRAKIEEYIAHRLEREAQIVDALRAGAATVPGIRERVYGPLDPELARAAEANVQAHLRKLVAEGRIALAANHRYTLVE